MCPTLLNYDAMNGGAATPTPLIRAAIDCESFLKLAVAPIRVRVIVDAGPTVANRQVEDAAHRPQQRASLSWTQTAGNAARVDVGRV